jgi:hypothetical protein
LRGARLRVAQRLPLDPHEDVASVVGRVDDAPRASEELGFVDLVLVPVKPLGEVLLAELERLNDFDVVKLRPNVDVGLVRDQAIEYLEFQEVPEPSVIEMGILFLANPRRSGDQIGDGSEHISQLLYLVPGHDHLPVGLGRDIVDLLLAVVPHQLVEPLRQRVEIVEERLEGPLVNRYPPHPDRTADDVSRVPAESHHPLPGARDGPKMVARIFLVFVRESQTRDGLKEIGVCGLLVENQVVSELPAKLGQFVPVAAVELSELGKQPLNPRNNGHELDALGSQGSANRRPGRDLDQTGRLAPGENPVVLHDELDPVLFIFLGHVNQSGEEFED